jgi:phage-related protein
MQIQTIQFRLVFTSKVQKKLDALPDSDRKQYNKAFECFANHGPAYRSLRTHRSRYKNGDIWSSSASMAKRFYWRYIEEQSIEVTHIDSH